MIRDSRGHRLYRFGDIARADARTSERTETVRAQIARRPPPELAA